MPEESLLASIFKRSKSLVTDRRSSVYAVMALSAIVIGLVAPYGLGKFTIDSTLDYFLIYMTLAQSYDLLGGFMGYVNLGIFVYFASSAYAFGVLYFTFHWLAPEAFIVGVVFSAFLGFLVSFPMFRLRGFYFAVATLALVQLGYYIVTTPPASVIFYTNGYGGINGLAADYIQSYYAIFALAVLTVALVYGISKTRLGLAITSIREDEQIAEASGINTGRTKRIVFVLSSAIAGASGCLFAWSQGSILPSTVFNLSNAFIPVTFALFGGTGTVIGPIIGTGIYSIIDTFLSSPFVQNSAYGNISFYEFAIIGFFLIIVGLFAPDGVIGISKRLISRRVKK